MNILIAEDDPVSRRLLQAALTDWGHQVALAADGAQALEVLRAVDAPKIAILDWVMPNLTGPEVCKARRELERQGGEAAYLILLTSREGSDDVVEGLEAGANDYITKPFDFRELRARVHVGERVVSLQSELARRVKELQLALDRVRQLQGLLPICSYCKRIRDDQNYWQQVEVYLAQHSGAQFSHSFCPDCYEKVVRPELEAFEAQNRGG